MRLSRYIIREQLSCNEQRCIYRAVRRADQRRVVIKSPAGRWPSPNQIQRCNHEYAILEQLASSPHTPTPLALDHEDGRPMVVVEAFDGPVLESLLDEPLDIEQALRIGLAVAAALADIHQRHVVHKDIKPSNILVSESEERAVLIDFGLATLLPLEHREAQPPGLLEGTPAYMSPEQTGRTNRGIDYRSDLYSFGVTLYRILTGQLPFAATDALQWCHSHLARAPREPRDLRPEIPAMVAEILLKLLAKAPEERYQSASGCSDDLRRCLHELGQKGAIAPFRLGQSDHPQRFHIAPQLYGRARQSAQLMDNFEQTAEDGQCRLVLVSGYSGIGKTSLVKELYKPITAISGRFLSGKADQYDRDIPHDVLIQAFQGLIRNILAECDDTVAMWRERISHAVGGNGAVLSAVLPEVEHIIGAQPLVPELGPNEARNRFNMVFRDFVRTMARADGPLVIFLDDMQWCDIATLQLLNNIFSDFSIQYIYFILAYRDNEVDASHPFAVFVDKVALNGIEPIRIELEPLDRQSIEFLLCDTLHGESGSEDIDQLAAIVAEKTGGNPFFVIQFLTRLYEDGLLVWDEARRRYVYEFCRVAEQDYTDNVVEHMVQRLRHLPGDTARALMTASCIGNCFALADLCVATGHSARQVVVELWPAAVAGLLVLIGSHYAATGRDRYRDDAGNQALETPVPDSQATVRPAAALAPDSASHCMPGCPGENNYRFLHDRVRQAAYSLLDEPTRAAIHLRVGRAWRRQYDEAATERRIFAITGQLNDSRELIEQPEERLDLARLNLRAGRKAKASTAYCPAVHHLQIAADLLPENSWQRHYSLTLAIHCELAESRYLNGEFETAEALFLRVTERTHSAPEKAAIYSVRNQLYQVSGDYEGGLRLAIETLALFGISVPEIGEGLAEETRTALAAVAVNRGDREIEELADAAPACDPDIESIIRIAANVLPCAYNARPEYFPWFVCLGVNTSLQHGITEWSDILFSSYGVLAVNNFRNPTLGFQYSRLALRINQRFEHKALRGAVWQVHLNAICYWNQPVTTYVDELEHAFMACQEVGDLVFAGFIAFLGVWLHIESCRSATEALREAVKYAAFIQKNKNATVLEVLRLQKQYIASLRGNTRSLTSYDDNQFDEDTYFRAMERARFGPGLAFFHVLKQRLHYYVGEYEQSLAHARSAQPLTGAIMGQPILASHYLYKALALCALYRHSSPQVQMQYREEIAESRDTWRGWVDTCPANFASRAWILEAALADIDGDSFGAVTWYEKAVHNAKTLHSVQDEALACLAASRFYAAHDLHTSAHAYARAAAHLYQRWGAAALAEHLHPGGRNLREAPEWHSGDPQSSSSSTSQPDNLDAVTMLKAARAISSELQLDNLVQRLLTIAMESAGADHARLLVVEDDGAITVFASDGRSYPMAEASEIARSVVAFVQHTLEPVLLEDGVSDPEYGDDLHILQNRVRSLLCLPIICQGRLRAMLYLENRLLASVFNTERVSMLNLLSSQAAISMENAALYMQLEEHNRTLEEKVSRRTAELHRASREAQAALRAAEDANQAKSRFLAHISHELRTPLNAILGGTSLLQTTEQTEEQSHLAHLVHHSGESMLELLNDLLDLSKIEAGKMELDIGPFNLRACVHDVVELMSHVAAKKGIRLERAVAPDVPTTVTGDAMRLRQILLNLLSNALKFTERGSVSLRVVCEKDGQLHFSVRDSGIGIPADRLDAIFSTFTQAETSTAKKYGGSGLGLAICKQFVELMGGRIWVDSEVGVGTEFHIVIAATSAVGAEPPAGQSDPATASGEHPLITPLSAPDSVCILLVEDNVISQKIAAKMLARLGYQKVDVAGDGQSAVASVRQTSYDLVFMDMMMPIMGGLEATRTIRGDPDISDQPRIVAMTANAMSDEIEACKEAGMDDYLSKPISLAALKAVLVRSFASSH
ncbi:MAG: AAA family ATPase [Proteobacteria bacterium]|nr:AAA family ATPase [Pseudomonadota bacterium]